jgi:prepilin-type N-terminal cleavage/methylation domain-containing protein
MTNGVRAVQRHFGFTLIEMMITVAVVAILAVIGYPSYQQYIVRGYRSAAQQFLLDRKAVLINLFRNLVIPSISARSKLSVVGVTDETRANGIRVDWEGTTGNEGVNKIALNRLKQVFRLACWRTGRATVGAGTRSVHDAADSTLPGSVEQVERSR